MAKGAAPPANRETNLVVYKARGGEEVSLSLETVKNFLITGNKDLVTIQEMVYFIGICKARGLNPFAKDCYLVKYSQNENAAIITAIDFYRSRAKAQPDCKGWEKGVIVQNKDTGELRYSKGLVLDNEDVVGGWFKAQPEGWTNPWELEVNLREYIKHTKSGDVTAFWQKPAMMISKVAESQGLRTLWPDEFRGTLAAEEAGLHSDQFGEIPELPPLPKEEPPPPPAVDLSKFSQALKAKKLPAERVKRMEKYFEIIAESQKATKVTVDQLKEKASGNFGAFFGAFEKWEAATFPKAAPPKEEPPQEEPPAMEPPGEAGPAEKVEEEAGPGNLEEGGEGEGDWPPAQEPVVVPFADRVTKLWHEIIGKGIPLSVLTLQVGDETKTIQRMNDITATNIDQVQALVDSYKPPTKKK